MNDTMAGAAAARSLPYAVFVGEALRNVLRIGDEFKFSRDGGKDFPYIVVRTQKWFSAQAREVELMTGDRLQSGKNTTAIRTQMLKPPRPARVRPKPAPAKIVSCYRSIFIARRQAELFT
jgi:hypothetical protein